MLKEEGEEAKKKGRKERRKREVEKKKKERKNFSKEKEERKKKDKKTRKRASLVAQWLRICLPTQATWVRALVWEDPTCRRAAGPVSHNY